MPVTGTTVPVSYSSASGPVTERECIGWGLDSRFPIAGEMQGKYLGHQWQGLFYRPAGFAFVHHQYGVDKTQDNGLSENQ
jgi:hypothetical protein